MSSKISQIKLLNEFLEQGFITSEEYEKVKRFLLNDSKQMEDKNKEQQNKKLIILKMGLIGIIFLALLSLLFFIFSSPTDLTNEGEITVQSIEESSEIIDNNSEKVELPMESPSAEIDEANNPILSLKVFSSEVNSIEYHFIDGSVLTILDENVITSFNKLHFENLIGSEIPNEIGKKFCELEFQNGKKLTLFYKLNDENRFYVFNGSSHYTAQYFSWNAILFRFTVNDPDGWSNLRENPGGKIIDKVNVGDNFLLSKCENDYCRIILQNGRSGYIHISRITSINLQ